MGFCILVWWVHRSSQWRVGYAATWFGTLRLLVLNATLLAVFGLGYMVALLSAASPPLSSVFLRGVFIPFMALVVAPITIGSLVLASSQHASMRHSVIGMTLSYAGIVVVVGSKMLQNALIVYLTQNMAWKAVHPSFLWIELFLPLYFLLFTTSGYVISEWLEYKRD
jgi:hypothetical protein